MSKKDNVTKKSILKKIREITRTIKKKEGLHYERAARSALMFLEDGDIESEKSAMLNLGLNKAYRDCYDELINFICEAN